MRRYEYREDELQALKDRGLTRTGDRGMDLCCRVWSATDADNQEFVVKSVSSDSAELDIHRRLSKMQSSRNRTVFANFVRCTRTILIVMPRFLTLTDLCHRELTFESLFRVMDKLLEGVQFMHENRTAYIDAAMSNAVHSGDEKVHGRSTIPANSIFLIDFGSAQCLSVGPGHGAMVTFFRTGGAHVSPPEGMELVDPYAFDVYALGRTLDSFTATAQGRSKGHIRISPCIWHYFDMLIDKAPSRRPSIWRARRLFRALWVWVNATDRLYPFLGERMSDFIASSGWWVLSKLIP